LLLAAALLTKEYTSIHFAPLSNQNRQQNLKPMLTITSRSSKMFVVAAGLVAVLTMMTTVASSISPNDVMGDWKIIELYDDQNQPVEIPTPPSDDGFVLHLVGTDNTPTSTLSLYTKIGNNIGGSVEFVDDESTTTDQRTQSIHIGPMRSTMMMPPPELYKLEQFLTKYLASSTTIKLNDEGDELVWLGDGRIVCMNVAKAAV
jgi:META domain